MSHDGARATTGEPRATVAEARATLGVLASEARATLEAPLKGGFEPEQRTTTEIVQTPIGAPTVLPLPINLPIVKGQVRADMRDMLTQEVLPQLRKLLKSKKLQDSPRELRAIGEFLAKYGVGTENTVHITETKVFAVVGAIAADYMEPGQFADFMGRLEGAMRAFEAQASMVE